MSVFRVKLSNPKQGLLDKNPVTGLPFATSLQRTIFVTGPKKIQRRLADGETFTDCNYWKRFAYPQVALEDAFIEVVTDDGSVYSDDNSENTYPVVWKPGVAGTIAGGTASTGTNMSLDIVATYGGPAMFVQLKNTDGSHAIKVKLNGSSSAVITLEANSTQIFNSGDLVINKLEFDNSFSGAGTVATIEVLMSVKSVINS
jgi:hypothetical protein